MNKLYAEAREALAQNQRLILAPVGSTRSPRTKPTPHSRASGEALAQNQRLILAPVGRLNKKGSQNRLTI